MIDYRSVAEAREHAGLRVVMVGGVPSPWGEAVKGILHVKQIPYVATRMGPEAAAVRDWTGATSAPIAVYEDEKPRTGWAEILLLAERLAPDPALIPADPEQRALLFGLLHEIGGEDGLGWSRRIVGIHAAYTTGVGFPRPVADYLAPKYGYRGDDADAAHQRVIDLLEMFAARLHASKSGYLIGDGLSAADIHLATMLALFAPLPADLCPMPESFRPGFEAMDEATREAFDPVLVEHRDRIYARHLVLPLEL